MPNEDTTLTLPGARLPGLLRLCSPVVVGGVRMVVTSLPSEERPDWVVVGGDVYPSAPAWCAKQIPDFDLDLTDATGRMHAAWWLACRYYGPGHAAIWHYDINGKRWVLAVIGPSPAQTRRHPEWDPILDSLDSDDPRLLPDGSCWVDAEALRLVCLHVAAETAP